MAEFGRRIQQKQLPNRSKFGVKISSSIFSRILSLSVGRVEIAGLTK